MTDNLVFSLQFCCAGYRHYIGLEKGGELMEKRNVGVAKKEEGADSELLGCVLGPIKYGGCAPLGALAVAVIAILFALLCR